VAEESARLEVQLEGHLIQTVLLEAPVLSIGRLPDNGLPLPHPMVSRYHAELRADQGRVVLTDVGSGNGTLVNGVRLLANQPRELLGGETIQIGPFLLTYVPARSVPPAPAAAEIERPPERRPVTEPVPVPAPVLPALGAEPRPTAAPTLPRGPRSAYLDDLPVIYQTNEFLGRFLLIFEAIWEPLEQRQDNIALYFDPRTCPAAFLSWLAGWLDVGYQPRWPEPRIRRLLAEAMDLYRWRGTRYGLTRLLELCTGLAVEITEQADTPFQFRVKVRVPADGSVEASLIEHLVQSHKPAHAGYVLEIER
jgi:phage tail-like protein